VFNTALPWLQGASGNASHACEKGDLVVRRASPIIDVVTKGISNASRTFDCEPLFKRDARCRSASRIYDCGVWKAGSYVRDRGDTTLNAISSSSKTARAYPPFRHDGAGNLARIGLIYIASSVVMEEEMWAMSAPGVSTHTARIKLPKVTVQGIEEMMNAPELEQAARLAGAAPIDILLFGGTSASFLHGTAYDHALIAKLRQWVPGPKITSASTATLAALAKVKAGKVALATPYLPEIHERAIRFLEENGHDVVKSAYLGISDDHALAEVSLEDVYDHVLSVDHPDASAIFVSCTNFRTVGVIEALEQRLGKPVVSANQASFWHSLELAGIAGAKPGYGELFAGNVAHGIEE
jgi:maleate isomerase